MKKLLVLFVLLISIQLITTSCEKEDCECGFVHDDGIDGGRYWVTIENDCSGVTKKWYLSQGNWMNAHPGSDYCITDSNGW